MIAQKKFFFKRVNLKVKKHGVGPNLIFYLKLFFNFSLLDPDENECGSGSFHSPGLRPTIARNTGVL